MIDRLVNQIAVLVSQNLKNHSHLIQVSKIQKVASQFLLKNRLQVNKKVAVVIQGKVVSQGFLWGN